MKKVITYGTFDLFHEGHYNLLRRAKDLGDYLIVGVTSESFDNSRGKLNVHESLAKRIENVKNSNLADEIIVEEYEGQKINDIQKYNVDIFTVGSDWTGKFDYLKEYCEVVYLERTKGISSTQLRADKYGIIKLGVVGCKRAAGRFITESKYVSGVNIEGIFGCNEASLKNFVKKYELAFSTTDYDEFIDNVDSVYIASSGSYDHIKRALEKGVHVLCEKPMVLSVAKAKELYEISARNKCVLLEAMETAYCPGFIRLVAVAKSGMIGKIKNIDVSYARMNVNSSAISAVEQISYPLLAVIKLLGENIEEIQYYTLFDNNKNIDVFAKANLKYKDAIATVKAGAGLKFEGDLIISGTKGYIYVPAPWWKTEYFEVRFDNTANNKRHYYKFQGYGLRYELAEFISMINKNEQDTYKLTQKESVKMIGMIERFLDRENVQYI